MIDLKKTQNNLLQHLEDVAKSIRSIEMPAAFKTEKITTLQIKDQSSIEKLAATLPTTGSRIYWIEVDNPSQLKDQFNQWRVKPSDVSYKFARINNSDDSNYVYVGSCTGCISNCRYAAIA